MPPDSTRNLDADQPGRLTGFELPPDISMPSLAEIEQILALGDRSWTSLLRTAQPSSRPAPGGRNGIVMGDGVRCVDGVAGAEPGSPDQTIPVGSSPGEGVTR